MSVFIGTSQLLRFAQEKNEMAYTVINGLVLLAAGLVFVLGMNIFPYNLYHTLLIISFVGAMKGIRYFPQRKRIARFILLFFCATYLPILWVGAWYSFIYPNPRDIASYDVALSFTGAANLYLLWAYSIPILILEITETKSK